MAISGAGLAPLFLDPGGHREYKLLSIPVGASLKNYNERQKTINHRIISDFGRFFFAWNGARLFREIGLDDEAMRLWHQKFEANYPNGHQSFLEWLAIPDNEITKIRAL